MIVLNEVHGGLANRIIQYAHFIAFCKENKLEIYNPSFMEYSFYFKGSTFQKIPYFKEGITTNNIAPTIIKRKYKANIFIKLLNLLFKIFLKVFKKSFLTKNIAFINFNFSNISNEEFLTLVKNKKYTFVIGWNFRDYDNVTKHYDTIRSYFEPLDEYQEKVNNFIMPLKAKYKTLIAVHIRRGDYKNYQDGKYFFSDETYLLFLKQLNKIFKDNVLFIIFSNEKIDLSYYLENNLNILQSNGNIITDLYSMSCCDYIIGPPSTFNLWAAYYGKKKHRYINHKDEIIKLTDFEIIKTL